MGILNRNTVLKKVGPRCSFLTAQADIQHKWEFESGCLRKDCCDQGLSISKCAARGWFLQTKDDVPATNYMYYMVCI